MTTTPTHSRGTKGLGSIRPNGRGGWEARAWIHGKRRSATAKTKAAAVARLREIELAEQPIGSPGKEATVEHALAAEARRLDARLNTGGITGHHRTSQQFAENRLRRDYPELLAQRIDDLTPSWAEEWVATLTGSPSTRAKIANHLKKSLATARRDGITKAPDPFEGVSLPSAATPAKEVRHATTEEVEHLAAVLQEPYRSLVLVLSLGLRPSEGLRLTWRDVNFDGGGSIRVTQSKTKAGIRTVPLTPEAREALLARWDEAEDREGLVWSTPSGGPLRGDNVRGAFNAVTPPDLTLYGLRHGAATRMLEAGVPVQVVSRILGHASPAQTLKHYAHSTSDMEAQAIAKLSISPEGPA